MSNPAAQTTLESDTGFNSAHEIMPSSIESDSTVVENYANLNTEESDRPPSRVQKVLSGIKKYATFAQLLRMGGAIGVVAAMSLFLLQGFEVANDLQRYLTLLAQTMVLTAAGFLVSFLLKDNKGARVFFGLGLVSVPVNFAVLGAMLYSLVSFDTQDVVYPALAGWQITGFNQFAIAAIAGAAVLIPVTFFGIAVMARSNARLLGSLSLISGLCLLIPVRDTAWIAMIALGVICLGITMLKRGTNNATHLKTLEGRFAQGLIFIAPVFMVARSLMLYSADAYAILVLSTMVYLFLRFSVSRLDAESIPSKLFYVLAMLSASVVTYLITHIVVENLGSKLELPIFSAVFAALMFELRRSAKNEKIRSIIFGASAMMLLLVNNLNTLFANGFSLAGYDWIIPGLVTAAIGVYALFQRRMKIALLSALLLVPHAYTHLADAWARVDFSNWLTLAVLGIAAIVFASLLERYGATLFASREKRRQSKEATTGSANALVAKKEAIDETEVSGNVKLLAT